MNYEEKCKEIVEQTSTLKLETGKNTIILLSEAEETEYVDDKGKITPQIKLFVEFEKKQYDWYIAVGKTYKSLYAQLMVLGKYRGKLTGECVDVLVTTATRKDGKQINTYMIVEAIEFLRLEEKLKEESV